jgi:hypothetical protein
VVFDVFEDVEHEDKVEGLGRGEGGVEGSDLDVVAVRAFVDEEGIGLEALDGAEAGEVIEEETIAAADVEDVMEWVPGVEALEVGEDEVFAGLPPPVVLPEILVLAGVAGLHEGIVVGEGDRAMREEKEHASGRRSMCAGALSPLGRGVYTTASYG